MNPKISVLIPSRERSSACARSIESLGKSKNIEILVYVDLDDRELDDYFDIRKANTKLWTGERYSYRNLHKYYNFLARQATGDWIMLWNDDVVMGTKDWVKKISAHDHNLPLVLSPYHPNDNLFPVISRKWYELLNYFAPNTHVDSWVQEIGQWTDTQVYVPDVKISHRLPIHFDNIDDETYKKGREAILSTSPEFNSPEMVEKRHKDADKIRRWYERHMPSR